MREIEKTLYIAGFGQRCASAKEAKAVTIKSLERRFWLIKKALAEYEALPLEDREAFLLGVQGDTGKTLRDWFQQAAIGLDGMGDIKTEQVIETVTCERADSQGRDTCGEMFTCCDCGGGGGGCGCGYCFSCNACEPCKRND